jgi:ergothioneine biosynthesis protein EgtB
MLPAFTDAPLPAAAAPGPLRWVGFEGGLVETGHTGDGFCFDNELPRHRCWLEPFELGDRLVTNGEYQQFIDDGGYRRPELWLADGWTALQAGGWTAPLYWRQRDGRAIEYTLHGALPRDPHRPVCHVSGYEADAYARWAGARLPTEQEWERAASTRPGPARGVGDACFHPGGERDDGTLRELYGDCWQWTASAYAPYPGYRPAAGAIGEYNGKFMSNQLVLRGSSCVTHREQSRTSYRNFFYPVDRWQFSGIRLARSPQEST